MPKQIGTETLNLKLVRSIQNFGITPGTAVGDVLDVAAVVERRDNATDALVETVPAAGGRFSEAEVRAAIGGVSELPDYDTLRTGLAKLMHALLDTR